MTGKICLRYRFLYCFNCKFTADVDYYGFSLTFHSQEMRSFHLSSFVVNSSGFKPLFPTESYILDFNEFKDLYIRDPITKVPLLLWKWITIIKASFLLTTGKLSQSQCFYKSSRTNTLPSTAHFKIVNRQEVVLGTHEFYYLCITYKLFWLQFGLQFLSSAKVSFRLQVRARSIVLHFSV